MVEIKNKRNKSFTILMATYNGERYLKEQLESIIDNMSYLDELIISDDASNDRTQQIIEDFIIRFPKKNIKFFIGPSKGLVQNFEFLLSYALNSSDKDYVVLSDQDDIWNPNKLSIIYSYLKKKEYNLVIHDAQIIDEKENVIHDSFFKLRRSKQGIIYNIMKNSYIGCCMTIKKECLHYLLPFPSNIPMHDQWIGLLCELYGEVIFIDEKLINYRRHNSNNSSLKGLSLSNKIKNRIIIVNCLYKFAYKKN